MTTLEREGNGDRLDNRRDNENQAQTIRVLLSAEPWKTATKRLTTERDVVRVDQRNVFLLVKRV